MGSDKELTLNDYILRHAANLELKEQNKKKSVNKAVKKYRNKFVNLHFILDKELVEMFRVKTKKLNVTQISVIRKAIEVFLEQNK